MRILLGIGLAVAAVALVAVVAAQPREEPKPKDERFQVHITEEMLRHTRLRTTLYFVGFAYSVGVLLLVLLSGMSRRIRDLAMRVSKRPVVSSLIYLAIL